MRLISETKTTGVYQNLSGSSNNTGFFLYGFPEYNIIRPGWTCVETGAIVTVVGDGISNYDITTAGTPFASGGFYSFTGPTGLELLGGMTIFTPPPSSPSELVLNFDAANYSAVPTNGSTIAGSGSFAINVVNPTPRISWNSANGGVFRVTTASTNNFLTFGPNYSSGTQAYTVAMAYRYSGTTAGRLLNANSASPDFLMGVWGDGATPKMNIAFAGGFTGTSGDVADTAWHFIWFSSTGTAGASKSKSYIATTTAPSGTYGTSSTNGGFNGLRLFGRFFNSTTSTEQVTADVGFVKVWNKELTLAEIQAEHATYKTRFGY